MAPRLRLLSPALVARLAEGAFVPERLSSPGGPARTDDTGLSERRNHHQLLAIIKRAVPFQPRVFQQRRDALLSLIDALDNGQAPSVLLLAPDGMGKTALARALLEMMGSGLEQALWHAMPPVPTPGLAGLSLQQELSLLFDAMLRLLPRPQTAVRDEGDPLSRLALRLEAPPSFPLLVVLDDVAPYWPLPLFQETLAFLARVPWLRLLMLADALPDDENLPAHVRLLRLPMPLTLAEVQASGLPPAWTPQGVDEALALTQGFPWRLRWCMQENQQAQADHGSADWPTWMRATTVRYRQTLPPEVCHGLDVLSLLRHPCSAAALRQLHHGPDHAQTNPADETPAAWFRALMQNTPVPLLLRRHAPPQVLCAQIYQNQTGPVPLPSDERRGSTAWTYDLFPEFARVWQAEMPQRARHHQQLGQFYAQASSPPASDTLTVATLAFFRAEAAYHQASALRDAPAVAPSNALNGTHIVPNAHPSDAVQLHGLAQQYQAACTLKNWPSAYRCLGQMVPLLASLPEGPEDSADGAGRLPALALLAWRLWLPWQQGILAATLGNRYEAQRLWAGAHAMLASNVQRHVASGDTPHATWLQAFGNAMLWQWAQSLQPADPGKAATLLAQMSTAASSGRAVPGLPAYPPLTPPPPDSAAYCLARAQCLPPSHPNHLTLLQQGVMQAGDTPAAADLWLALANAHLARGQRGAAREALSHARAFESNPVLQVDLLCQRALLSDAPAHQQSSLQEALALAHSLPDVVDRALALAQVGVTEADLAAMAQHWRQAADACQRALHWGGDVLSQGTRRRLLKQLETYTKDAHAQQPPAPPPTR